MIEERVRSLSESKKIKGSVVYWMSRDQRVHDNWALIFSQQLAKKNTTFLMVIFCAVPQFLEASSHHQSFMISGLKEVESRLKNFNIPFRILLGEPDIVIPEFIKENKVGAIISDFSPLRIKIQWINNITSKITIPFYEVDAHNIIPCWLASNKQEYAAYTFRPRIRKMLPQFLEEFPTLQPQSEHSLLNNNDKNWNKFSNSHNLTNSKDAFDWVPSGEKAARVALKNFLDIKLTNYDKDRNDPNLDGQSLLSPYLHFGQISAQRIALEVSKSKTHPNSKNTFLEELIIRRELSDNFCFYNPFYDSINGFPPWARQTLNKHRNDKREYIYSLEEFEQAKTHDDAWNAAQLQMSKTGKMHGYMRMYWGKKILEWTNSPEEALKIAIYLNDKYELDGRDPNGYVGIAWCIGGLHDRAWKERAIFGKIRYMNYAGLKKKFSIENYINKYLNQNVGD